MACHHILVVGLPHGLTIVNVYSHYPNHTPGCAAIIQLRELDCPLNGHIQLNSVMSSEQCLANSDCSFNLCLVRTMECESLNYLNEGAPYATPFTVMGSIPS